MAVSWNYYPAWINDLHSRLPADYEAVSPDEWRRLLREAAPGTRKMARAAACGTAFVWLPRTVCPPRPLCERTDRIDPAQLVPSLGRRCRNNWLSWARRNSRCVTWHVGCWTTQQTSDSRPPHGMSIPCGNRRQRRFWSGRGGLRNGTAEDRTADRGTSEDR